VINCHSTGTVRGYTRVGGLVGQNQGNVLHSYSYGTVSGHSTVGGLVGYNNNYGKIADSFSTSEVSGDDAIGGLAGRNYGSTATSYSASEVSGSKWVGGLVGANGRGNITSSYSTGSVTGTTWVGGLVGSMGAASSRVLYCYSTGSVSGGDNVGGLVGRVNGGVTSSFWDMETSSQTFGYGGMGKTTSQMQTAATFLEAGWDFVGETEDGLYDVWKIVEGQTYPLLSWQKYGGGSGEPNDPYLIYTSEHLNALGAEPNDYDRHFKLMADIDLSGYTYDRAVIAPDTNDAEDWFQGRLFGGVIDGNAHMISNITIVGIDYLGLFGKLDVEAEVKNLTLSEVDIEGSGECIGGVAGWVDGIRVANSNGEAQLGGACVIDCSSSGKVSGFSEVGGLIGFNLGYVLQCHSGCKITAGGAAGGLVGRNLGRVIRSHSTGDVIAEGRGVGGLFGFNGDLEIGIAVIQCYSTGYVSGDRSVGGLVGGNVSRAVVTDCYAKGHVSGTFDVGGLVGSNWGGSVAYSYSTARVEGGWWTGGGGLTDGGQAIDSFWDVQTSGQTRSGGGVGKTTAEMQTATTFLEAGWDFIDETANGTEDIWWILEGQDYPRLWWEAIPYDSEAVGQ
jgi:hypothetical protein